jgi:hypothetical protein
MKKIIVFSVVCLFSIVTMALAVDNGAAEINLKDTWKVEGKQKPVIFPHATHQSNNECVECHATAEGGNFALPGTIAGQNEENAAHNFCWTCHTKKNNTKVKKICTRCHKGK